MKYNRNIYSTRAAAMRARELERAEREKKKTTGIIAGSIALVLVACIAAGAFVYGAFTIRKANIDTAPAATVSQTADANAPKAANQQTNAQTNQVSNASTANAQDTDDPNIKIINGDRVYIDTKHQPPANTGTPLHFTNAYGKTSYGFDWTYDTDNSNVVIACNYNFSKQQYDFIIYGASAGTAHLTLYYNTDDNTQAPTQLTVNVDNNLNVTQG